MELTDHVYDNLLNQLTDISLPVPFFELSNSRGDCIGQAELAWPTINIAILDDDEDFKIWESNGWKVYHPNNIEELTPELFKEYV